MYCHTCGTEVPNDASFCSTCGRDLKATAQLAALPTEPARSEADTVRQALRDDYEVAEELGRGGMAVVYRARELVLDREVALKVLPFSMAFDKEFVERFLREARTAASLEHPNIIPVYRVGRSGQVIYFAMRFLRGESLAARIKQRGALAPAEIRDLLARCASALGYAHANGIIHRDIKPDNILFKEDGQPVLCDFGIAKAATGTRLTGTGMAIGTPFYMSPEQARAQPIDGRSDLYSLGVVAYQCLTGRVPFEGEDSFAIGYKHIHEPPQRPVMHSPEQRRLYAVIDRMMAKDPDDRYQTANALIEALTGQATSRQSFMEAPTAYVPAVPAPAAPVDPGATEPQPAMAPSSPPMAATTPTTPLPSHPGNLGRQWRHQRGPKRRSGVLVGMLFLFAGAGLGGGGYYYTQVLERPIPYADQISTIVDGWTATFARDSAPVDPSPADSGSAAPAGMEGVAEALPEVDSVETEAVAAVDSVSADPEPTGTLVIVNAGPDVRLTIDGAAASGNRHELAAGVYELRLLRSGYREVVEERNVLPGKVDTLRVQWQQRPAVTVSEGRDGPDFVAAGPAQCLDPDPRTYNRDGACFDQAPDQIDPTFVPHRIDRPWPIAVVAVVWVRVETNGRSSAATIAQSSGDSAYDSFAVQTARRLRYEPARRDGQPVQAWAQFRFQPDPSRP